MGHAVRDDGDKKGAKAIMPSGSDLPYSGTPPSTPAALSPELLYRRADLSGLVFTSTADVPPLDGIAGQDRAVDAVRFAAKIAKPGFNLFVIGRAEADMRRTVRSMLEPLAATDEPPPDQVYVNNFADPQRPIALALPAGRAPQFSKAMRALIDDLGAALPAAFSSEEYQTRRGAIEEVFQKKQADAFTALHGKAREKQLVLLRTPMGFTLAPARDGQVVPPEEFRNWDKDKQQKVQEDILPLEKELERIMRHVPAWEKERRDDVRKLDRDMATLAIGQSIDEAKADFADLPAVIAQFEAVRSDLIENVAMFVMKGEGGEPIVVDSGTGGPFDRYLVNVLVTREPDARGLPIVEELHPTLGNLVGRVEYLSRQGALVTNFRLIKAGALHRANGGYLLLDARSLLTEPFSWAALKRALGQGKVTIEDAGRVLGLTSTVTLEPAPIALDLKVVLFGERMLYYLLVSIDPELSEHFKVLADFEDDITRTPDSEAALARLVASVAGREGLRPIARDGVALLVEHAARLADDAGKLTLLVDLIRDVAMEADFWAGEAGEGVISAEHVARALDKREWRASRLRDRSKESILKDIALIRTEGKTTGQINGLSVIELGGFRFGRPTRITCRVRPGGGQVVDIEREAKLGGPIHSKGVLILAGFLAGRYALDAPMSLYASLVFEQSYGGVEGDSASSAELYTLLSALADAPLRQDIAVTGSVNQHGEVQAIGGVNEKIEGFFDVCNARRLTGRQGVAIPRSNVQHLMLRKDIVDACAAGRFSIYPVASIDEGLQLLTGLPAGERGEDGRYPADTLNGRVEQRLHDYAKTLQRFGKANPAAQERSGTAEDAS